MAPDRASDANRGVRVSIARPRTRPGAPRPTAHPTQRRRRTAAREPSTPLVRAAGPRLHQFDDRGSEPMPVLAAIRPYGLREARTSARRRPAVCSRRRGAAGAPDRSGSKTRRRLRSFLMLTDLLSARLLPIGRSPHRKGNSEMEPQMMNVLFGRIAMEGLEQRRQHSRRQSIGRPGIIGRFSHATLRHVSDLMPRASHQLIHMSKRLGVAR
jgi:hypothetical protein